MEADFGNLMHGFTVEGPLDGLVITAEGEIETQDSHGVVRGQVEPLPSAIFLRNTTLTAPDAAIHRLAEEAAAGDGTELGRLHGLMRAIRGRMRFEVDATDTGTTGGTVGQHATRR